VESTRPDLLSIFDGPTFGRKLNPDNQTDDGDRRGFGTLRAKIWLGSLSSVLSRTT
jgi:hypothetical protein